MKDKILVVDDLFINRDILTEILKDKFEILEAVDGREALREIELYKGEIAAVLLDLLMPVMDGYKVLEELSRQKYMERVPVLVISGENSVDSEKKCLEFGVADFIHKPFDESLVMRRVCNVIDLYAYKNSLEDKVKEQTDILVKQNDRLQKQAERLERNNHTIIDVLGTLVESRNLESGDHIRRVKDYTGILAEQVMNDHPEYGLTQQMISVMVPASALHDVGKIAIPDSILLKPGKLTSDEFEKMKEHTTRGCTILENIEGVWDDEYKRMSYEICRHHHERFDGRGYPDGLKGDDIPISAQIVSIADVYDALVTKRVYKDAYTLEKAFGMIMDGECGVFSPKILGSFQKVKAKFEETAR